MLRMLVEKSGNEKKIIDCCFALKLHFSLLTPDYCLSIKFYSLYITKNDVMKSDVVTKMITLSDSVVRYISRCRSLPCYALSVSGVCYNTTG
jgi:hypothetical protein